MHWHLLKKDETDKNNNSNCQQRDKAKENNAANFFLLTDNPDKYFLPISREMFTSLPRNAILNVNVLKKPQHKKD